MSKLSIALAGTGYNTFGITIAGNGPNCGLVYICPGKINARLGIVDCLYLLIYSLLYSFFNSLGLLNLLNGIICGLALDNLIL